MIRVMTYNVRYFAHPALVRGAASTRRGIDGITEAIAGLETLPHVVCLQEVEARSIRSTLSHTKGSRDETQLEAVMQSMARALTLRDCGATYRAHYFPAHAYSLSSARFYTTGLAVLLRNDVELEDHNADAPCDITHRRSGMYKRIKQARVCAWVKVRCGGETMEVFNTHLSLPAFVSRTMFKSGGRMGYGLNQQHEVDALAAFINASRSSDRYLVVGDFNSLPASPAYQRLLEHLGMVDCTVEKTGTPPEELRQSWPTAGFMHLRMRLDHIFAGPGLRCLDLEDTHPFGTPGRWHGLSDHVPIVGRFAFR